MSFRSLAEEEKWPKREIFPGVGMRTTDRNGRIMYYDTHHQLHCEDGPAVIDPNDGGFYRGNRQWWWHGKLHRIDGPAIEHDDNGGGNEYWILGRSFSREEFLKHFDDVTEK